MSWFVAAGSVLDGAHIYVPLRGVSWFKSCFDGHDYGICCLRPLAGCELNLVAAILSTKRAQVFRPLAGCELVRCHHQPNGVCIQLASVPLRGVSWFVCTAPNTRENGEHLRPLAG